MTPKQLADLLGDLSGQMRENLSTFHLVSLGLITAQMREENPLVDQKAAVLDQSFYQLLRLAENLSDSQYLVGDKPLRCQLTDMVTLVGDICQHAQSALGRSDVRIVFQCTTAQLSWGVNRRSMERVVWHLLSNGVKYACDTVVVTLSQTKEHLRLTVEDNGLGMSQEQIERALRVGNPNNVYTDLKRGLGLGLPISQAIVNWHGGQLGIKSEKETGTVVCVELPAASHATLGLADVPEGYGSAFNQTLVRLADALPSQAFEIRTQDL